MDESGGHNAANDKPTEQTVVAGCKTGSRTAIQDDDGNRRYKRRQRDSRNTPTNPTMQGGTDEQPNGQEN